MSVSKAADGVCRHVVRGGTGISGIPKKERKDGRIRFTLFQMAASAVKTHYNAHSDLDLRIKTGSRSALTAISSSLRLEPGALTTLGQYREVSRWGVPTGFNTGN